MSTIRLFSVPLVYGAPAVVILYNRNMCASCLRTYLNNNRFSFCYLAVKLAHRKPHFFSYIANGRIFYSAYNVVSARAVFLIAKLGKEGKKLGNCLPYMSINYQKFACKRVQKINRQHTTSLSSLLHTKYTQ